MTPEERFKRSLLVGAAASPFRGNVTVLVNGKAIDVPRCQVDVGTNKAKHDEFGVELVKTLTAHVPKSALEDMPEEGRDGITHKDVSYKIVSVEGADDCSPFWIIDGEKPL